MKVYKIAAINLGSTSTKIAYYENENCVFKDSIVHPARELEGFSTIWEQSEFRKQAIEGYLKEKGILTHRAHSGRCVPHHQKDAGTVRQ